jgi:rhodanese-related sulfurtransferase
MGISRPGCPIDMKAIKFYTRFLVFLSLGVTALFSCTNKEVKSVSTDEFLKIANDPGIVILDVRTESEYSQGHMPNSVLLDYHDENFREKINALDKTKPYYVYCKSGSRSSRAVKIMNELGFRNAYNITGGITGILKSNVALVK